MSFKDVTVNFPLDEWLQLTDPQRRLHQAVMPENCGRLVSAGEWSSLWNAAPACISFPSCQNQRPSEECNDICRYICLISRSWLFPLGPEIISVFSSP